MRLAILPILTLTTTALASGASIISAINTISASAIDLDLTIATWSGDVLSTLPIIIKSTALLLAIKNGTVTAQASDALSVIEVIAVAAATQRLAIAVDSTLTTVVDAKPKFDKLLLAPVILLNLELQRDASADFADAVIEKVPEALQETAKLLVQPIDESFERAIDEYALF